MSWMDRPHKSSNLQIWNPYTSMNATWVTASLFSFQQIKSTFLSSRLLAAFFKDEVKAYEAYVIDTWTPKLLQHTPNATPETWNMKHYPSCIFVGWDVFCSLWFFSRRRVGFIFHFPKYCMKKKDFIRIFVFVEAFSFFSLVECPTKSVCIESCKMKG